MAGSTHQPMTRDTFERCLHAYGPDLKAWPQGSQAPGQLYAETPDGLQLLRHERALRAAFTALPEVTAESAFLDRLIDLPKTLTHSPPGYAGLSALFRDVFGLADFGTPRALVAQGIALAVLFAVGLTAGQAGVLRSLPSETEDVDLVALWTGDTAEIWTEGDPS